LGKDAELKEGNETNIIEKIRKERYMKRVFFIIILISLFLMTGSAAKAQAQYNQNYMSQTLYDISQPLRAYNSYDFSSNDYYQRLSSFQPGLAFSPLNRYFQSSWLNHPPIVTYGPNLPIVSKAGGSATAAFWVIDPDYEYFYTSSSIGATGRLSDGTPVWTFSTNFPGWYTTQNVFYDQRGGFAQISAPVYVKPWWSF